MKLRVAAVSLLVILGSVMPGVAARGSSVQAAGARTAYDGCAECWYIAAGRSYDPAALTPARQGARWDR